MREQIRMAWTEPTMKAGKTEDAEMLLYGEIIANMPNEYKWDENDTSASDFDKALKAVKEKGAKNLTVRMNCPGGVVFEAIAMRSMLANAGFKQLGIRIEGICASAATLIATVPGAKVSMVPGSQYMIHNPRCFAIGTADDMDNMSRQLRLIEQTSREFYAAKTGQTDEQLKNWMDAETWFSASDAVSFGFADEVCDETQGKAVACVSTGMMAAMKADYRNIPDSITEEAEGTEDDRTSVTTVAAAMDAVNNKEGNNMDIKDLTLEQLRAENPGLVESIMQSAAENERMRMQEIDDLTPAGYEEMAAKAKSEGTSSMDYHKAIIKAQREKAAKHIEDRKTETAKAAEVIANAAEDNDSEDDELKKLIKDVSELASNVRIDTNGMY